MATLRKRNGKWQAIVRRTGHAPRAKSFTLRTDATRWIRQVALALKRALLGFDPTVPERTTVADLLTRYANEVTPSRR